MDIEQKELVHNAIQVTMVEIDRVDSQLTLEVEGKISKIVEEKDIQSSTEEARELDHNRTKEEKVTTFFEGDQYFKDK